MPETTNYAERERQLTQEHDEIARYLEETEGSPGGYRRPDRVQRRERLEQIRAELEALPGQRQRAFLEGELERARGGNEFLKARTEEALARGGRSIQEGERRRLAQAESGLASMGLGDSPLGERGRRAEREVTAIQEGQLASGLLINELDQTFKAESDAIQRLFMSGENELAFVRQAHLLQMQLDAALKIAEMESDASMWGSVGSFFGDLATLGVASKLGVFKK